MSRQDVINTILDRLRAVCKMKGIVEKQSFDESTILIGTGAILDSLGFAMFLVQVEESLNRSSGTQTALVQRLFAEDIGDETVGSLSDRLLSIMEGRS